MTTTFNLHSLNQKIKSYKFNWLIYIFLIIFLSGLIFGAISIKYNNAICENIGQVYLSYISKKETRSDFSLFINSFLIWSAGIIFTFFAGLSAVGIPVVGIIPGLFGYLIGTISGYLYETYLLKGLGYCGIIIFPSAAIALSAITFACKESLKMSKMMLSLLNNGRDRHHLSFKDYCLKYLIYILLCAAAALSETITFNLFSGLFVFQ